MEKQMIKILEEIRSAAWAAQGELSGIVAVCGKMVDYLTGDTIENDHTVDHVMWMHISAEQKIKEIGEMIDRGVSIKCETANADKEARSREPL